MLFTVGASEIYQRLFVPEANLVVSGKFRLGRDACTVDISIASVTAVVFLPVAVSNEVATPVVGEASPSEKRVASGDAPAKSKRKTSTTRSKKAAKTPIAA